MAGDNYYRAIDFKACRSYYEPMVLFSFIISHAFNFFIKNLISVSNFFKAALDALEQCFSTFLCLSPAPTSSPTVCGAGGGVQ